MRGGKEGDRRGDGTGRNARCKVKKGELRGGVGDRWRVRGGRANRFGGGWRGRGVVRIAGCGDGFAPMRGECGVGAGLCRTGRVLRLRDGGRVERIFLVSVGGCFG